MGNVGYGMCKAGFAIITVVLLVRPAIATDPNVEFTDDFSAFINTDGLSSGSLTTSKTDSLKWNITSTFSAGGVRLNIYSITMPSAITSIEFDWRFANDGFDSRLLFQLWDENDTVLWTAPTTPGGVGKPLHLNEFVATDTMTLKFIYIYVGDTIWGKPAFFDSSNIDDWDAFVDNVTLTFHPDPQPPAPVELEGTPYSPYGLVTHSPAGPELYDLFDKVQAVGIDWIRIDVYWFNLEGPKGTFHWDQIDVLVAAAQARGLNIFASIWGTPTFTASGSDGYYYDDPPDPCDFYDFCYAASQRFAGKIKYWGLWNEANGNFEIRDPPVPSSPSAWGGTLQEFIDIILIPGADGIHAGNPTALVGGPELTSMWEGAPPITINWFTWLRACLEQAGDKLDFITHHVYGHPSFVTNRLEKPTSHGGDPNFWLTDEPSVKEVLEYTGFFGKKPFWLTETGGWKSDDGGEDFQAELLGVFLDQWYTGRPGRDWLDKVFYYQLYDQDEGGNPFNTGIVTAYPDYNEKAIYYAYQDFINEHDIECLSWLGADINKDCFVNIKDFGLLAFDWLRCNELDPDLCSRD